MWTIVHRRPQVRAHAADVVVAAAVRDEGRGSAAAGTAHGDGPRAANRRVEEQVHREHDGEVLRQLEGEERRGRGEGDDLALLGDRSGDRHAAPRSSRTARDAAIEQASPTVEGGGLVEVQVEEGQRRYHCRSCPLGVWVASSVECIEVEEEVGRGLGSIIGTD